MEIALRFLAGGTLVCLFSIIGEVMEPKSFAGLFGAAPSVALASLGITIATASVHIAVVECRSMLIGALAFGIYSAMLTWALGRNHVTPMKGSIAGLALWGAIAFLLWFVVLS